MNKEEILNILENIQRKMQEAKISEYELQDRVEILENIFKLKEKTERDIKYLNEKLSTDDNYIEKRPALYDESRRFNLEDYINACEEIEQANRDEITRRENIIEKLKFQIMESQKIVEEIDQRLPGLDEKLRDSADVEETKFRIMQANYDSITSLRDAHRQNITESQRMMKRSEDRLESLNNSIEELTAATEEAKMILENFDRIQASVIIDDEAKKTDENKLKILKERMKYYNETEDLVSYDHEKSIAQIISDYKEDKITSEEVTERVKELRRYVVEDVLIEDVQARTEDIKQNLEAQDACNNEIIKLEEKLSNDDNYIPSILVAEKNNRQLEKIDMRIAGSAEQIRIYNEEMEKLSQDIEVCDELTAEVEQEILDIQKQIRRLGMDINPEVEQELLNKIASKNEDLEYLKVVKSESIRNLEHDSIELSSLNSKQIRFTELQSRLVKSLEKRNGIDISAKRLDELELFNLRSNLTALQNRGIYIASLYDDFDLIINAKVSVPVIGVQEDTPTNKLTDQDKEKIENFINNLEDVSPVKNDSDDNNKSQYFGLDDQKNVEDSIIEESKLTTDPIGLGDTRNMKFKDLGEDDKKRKKAENRGFIKSLAIWLGIMLGVAAAAIGLRNLIKGINNKDLDSKLKEAQENPTKYEDMTQDEIKDSLEEDLNSLNIPVKTEKQNDDLKNSVDDKNSLVDDNNNLKNKIDSNAEKMDSEVIAPINSVETTNNINKNISMEEQKRILAEQGIYETPDAPVTTVVDAPVYNNDENSYGEFHEDNTNNENTNPVDPEEDNKSEIPSVEDEWGEFHEDNTDNENTDPVDSEEDNKSEIPSVEDEWGEFYEDGVENSETPQQNPEIGPSNPQENPVTEPAVDNNTMNVNINTGESFVVKLDDKTYEVNNGNEQYVDGASSLIDLPGIRNLVEDDKGTVKAEITGNTVEELKRDTPLTAADIQKIRDEIAAQYGMAPITEEDVKNANDQYQEQLSQEETKNK